LNFPDILMAAGEYQLKPPLPFTPGVESAGDVVEVNAAEGVAVGDRVIVKMRHGAYCDEAVATPSQLVRMPSTFDYAEGATFLAGHGTAYHALIDRGQVRPGEVLLVHGAGGGVGLAAVEMGKMLGATVIATASSDEKLERLKAFGLDHGVNYATGNLVERIGELTGAGGVDLVIDPVGGRNLVDSLAVLAWRGTLVSVGVAARAGAAIDAQSLWRRNNTLRGVSLASAILPEYARIHPMIGALIERVASGELRVEIDRSFPLAETAAAHGYVESRRAFGRVVITP
jgi:NADPH2:quinone reductase